MFASPYKVNQSVMFYGKKCIVKRFRFNQDDEQYEYDLIDVDQTTQTRREEVIPNVPQDEID